MKVKAIITLQYCSNDLCEYYKKECPAIVIRDNCEDYENTSHDNYIDDMCVWETEKTIYIDKDVKNIEIDRINGLKVKIGRTFYINDYRYYYDIEYLEIDGKTIIQDYTEVEE